MKAGAGLPVILACASLLLIGCGDVVRRGTVLPAATPAAPYAAPVQHAQPVQEGQSASIPVHSDVRGTKEEATPSVDPAATGSSAQSTHTAARPSPDKDFVPTQELYDRTFGEVEGVVESLNRIIAADDYAQWLTYLTPEYVAVTSDPAFLADASKSPVLAQKAITLTTLRDYFDDVVVRSRTRVRLDSLSFIDEQHVKALARMGNSMVILYYLVREGDTWKVGMWQNATNQ